MIKVERTDNKSLFMTVVFVFMLGFLLVFLSFMVYPWHILSVDNPIKIVSKNQIEYNGHLYPLIKESEDIVIQFSYTKKGSYPEYTYRTLVCEKGEEQVLLPVNKNLEEGSFRDVALNNLSIQRVNDSGLCYIKYLVTYSPNILHRGVRVSTQTENFYIQKLEIK